MTAPERLSRWPAVADGTWEQKPTGEMYQTVRYFRAYPNPAASVAHYQQNLTYFAGIHEWAGEATDKAGIISMLGNIGRTYVTDLEYGQKAERVFNDIFER